MFHFICCLNSDVASEYMDMKPGVSYAVPPKADKKRPIKSGEYSDKEFCLLVGVQREGLHGFFQFYHTFLSWMGTIKTH